MFPVFIAHALADCPRMFDTGDILEAANSAESAFTKVDRAGFADSRAALEARTACASEVLSVNAQARIHRVETLGAFLDGRLDRVPLALAGVFATEAGHQIPTALLLDGQGAVLATHYRWPDEAGFDWVVPVAGSSVATSNLSGARAEVEQPPPGEWGHRAPR